MKRAFLFLLVSLLITGARCQSLYFPPAGNSWDTLSPASLGWCEEKIPFLLNYLEAQNSKAFIVLKDGKIVIEKYFGTFTRDSSWYWASAGKTLTSFLTGIAQQEGLLSIDDTSSRYLGTGWTSCTPGKEALITIRNQLTMTSGLDDGVADPYCTADTCLHCLADAGTRWAYHNGPYTLLDNVLQAATGKTMNVYINQKLKMPTGMTGAFFPSGENNVFFSQPRSMARFGLLILNRGNWNGTQIMTDTAYFRQMTNTSQNLNLSYGYLWWLNGKASYMVPQLQVVFNGPLSPHAPAGMIAAMGKNGQFINVVPDQNLVFIRMGNAPDGNDVPFLMNDSIWKRLNEVMCTVPTAIAEPVKKEIRPVVYPNPSLQFLNVAFPGTFDVVLYDQCGRELLSAKNITEQIRLNTADLPAGVYYLKVLSEAGTSYTRVVHSGESKK